MTRGTQENQTALEVLEEVRAALGSAQELVRKLLPQLRNIHDESRQGFNLIKAHSPIEGLGTNLNITQRFFGLRVDVTSDDPSYPFIKAWQSVLRLQDLVRCLEVFAQETK